MAAGERVPLGTVARQWARLGSIGFGGPPAHIVLLRQLCVERRGWIDAEEFEDALATVNMLPGPASTQLAIFCAWRAAGSVGALVGGAGFILPGLAGILALSAVVLEHHPPRGVAGAAAGAGAAVAAVALQAAVQLVPASWKRIGAAQADKVRFVAYAAAGAAAAVLIGRLLVLVLLACGVCELVVRPRQAPAGPPAGPPAGALSVLALAVPAAAGLGALVWLAFEVGALSYGGGFVIVPLMQHSAVNTYHFMTASQFLAAVALGQVTPGPVVLTVAVVGYAAAGVGGGLLAVAVAFAPSFLFVLAGGRSFDRLRANARV